MTAPFKLGDRVEHNGYAGTVVEVTPEKTLVYWDIFKELDGDVPADQLRKLRTEEEKRKDIHAAALYYVQHGNTEEWMADHVTEALEKLREALK